MRIDLAFQVKGVESLDILESSRVERGHSTVSATKQRAGFVFSELAASRTQHSEELHEKEREFLRIHFKVSDSEG